MHKFMKGVFNMNILSNTSINDIKKFITAITALLSSLLGVLYVPVLLMIACNIIDYITGLMAAKNRPGGGISSYRSIKGIQKKICMWLLVVVGAILDQLLKYAATTAGINLPITFLVACIVAIWIICNEVISILENIVDIGVDIPSFLMPIVKHIKSQTEQIGNSATDKGNDEEN
jgi:toxin secretion/phage lysis holin